MLTLLAADDDLRHGLCLGAGRAGEVVGGGSGLHHQGQGVGEAVGGHTGVLAGHIAPGELVDSAQLQECALDEEQLLLDLVRP